MKKVNTLVWALPLTLFTAGYVNMDDINRRFDDHERRLQAVEQFVTIANDEIATIHSLIKAEQDRNTVVSIR